MEKLRIYIDEELAVLETNKAHRINDYEYFYRYSHYLLVENINNADVILNPVSWNNYKKLTERDKKKIKHFYDENRDALIISFMDGDYWLRVPKFAVASIKRVVLTYSVFKSKASPNILAFPVIWSDPFHFIKVDNIVQNAVFKKPSISFCGHVNVGLFGLLTKFAQRVKNEVVNSFTNQRYNDVLMPPTWFRYRALRYLEKHSNVATDFIYRRKYRGGVKKGSDEDFSIREEYYRNIFNNMYTLCIRGEGNFSIRFFDTLAMGRIPILLDTDCKLPFEHIIDYSKVILKVDNYREIPEVVERHFGSLTEKELIEILSRNRKIWEEYFTEKNIIINVKHEWDLISKL